MVAVAAVVVVVALRRETTTQSPAASERSDAASADVVRWVETELPAETPVRAAGDVLGGLTAAGGGDRFRPQESGAPGGLLVVRGEQPPGSAVLARFGGTAAGALALVDPNPGRPTAEQLERRQRLCAAILANPGTGATGRSADVLRSAAVDARLLGLLAALVAQLGAGVADFPQPPGEPADGPPARRLLIDRVGTATVGPGEAAADRLVDFLRAQLPPFAPDDVEVTDEGVLVGFRYESSPDAVVEANTP
ncbi:hypothetical protein [Blastococcus sp. CT_GayMR16]|uniref:hypothetical protein n=1 Tax=Blastococcus sp. CT_GayMR16 TaxID=2559607 RepID=UPI001073513B|nr:hypothetical protein [Blastococcus sp. CT_GayMR16]TFV89128.1 hypothetical protein E4P38_08250 [Blastococcus sp. CT_GayMR16]